MRTYQTVITVLLSTALAWATACSAQELPQPRKITMINMGGDDCPPCRVWRALELPKLQQQPDFQSVEYVYVVKSIESAVPPRFFLPVAAKPHKEKLDAASGGMSGSPQVAILLNGEVQDYIYGTRTAEEYMQMVRALQSGAAYPFERCLQRRDRLHCEVRR